MTGHENQNEQVSIQFNSFESNLKNIWKRLNLEKDFCDVTFACEDNLIKAHKIIVSSCSPILKNILKQNQIAHPIIYLRGVKFKYFEKIINLIYQGDIIISQEDFSGFHELARDLKINGFSGEYGKQNTKQAILPELTDNFLEEKNLKVNKNEVKSADTTSEKN